MTEAIRITHPRMIDRTPSAKCVYFVLKTANGPLSKRQIIHRTVLSETAGWRALRELQEHDVVEQLPHGDDERQDLFRLADAE